MAKIVQGLGDSTKTQYDPVGTIVNTELAKKIYDINERNRSKEYNTLKNMYTSEGIVVDDGITPTTSVKSQLRNNISTPKYSIPYNASEPIKTGTKLMVDTMESAKSKVNKFNELSQTPEYQSQIQKASNAYDSAAISYYKYLKTKLDNDDISGFEKIVYPIYSGITNPVTIGRYSLKNDNGDYYIMPTYADMKKDKVRGSYNSWVGRLYSDITFELGRQTTAWALNSLVPGSGAAAYYGSMWLDSANEAIQDGADQNAAMAYATVTTALELGVGKLLGATQMTLGSGTSDFAEAVTKSLGKKFIQSHPKLASAIGNAVGEGLEEFVQEFLDAFNKEVIVKGNSLTSGVDKAISWDTLKDALYSALVGAATGSVNSLTESSSSIRERIGDNNVDSPLRNDNNEIETDVEKQIESKLNRALSDEEIKNIQKYISDNYSEDINGDTSDIDIENIVNAIINDTGIINPSSNVDIRTIDTSDNNQITQLQQQVNDLTNTIEQQNRLSQEEQREYEALNNIPFELSKTDSERLAYLKDKLAGNIKYPSLKVNNTFNDVRTDYYKLKNQGIDNFDPTILKKAMNIVPTNKSNRRTKADWLNVANYVGMNMSNVSSQELSNYAIRSWLYAQPNTKQNLNRQSQKYIPFGIDEWVNAVYKGAGVGTKSVSPPYIRINEVAYPMAMRYNNQRSEGNVNRTNKIDRTNTLLRNADEFGNQRYDSSNKGQEDSQKDRYVYSPKSYDNDSKTASDIFGESVKTNIDSNGNTLNNNQIIFFDDSMIRNSNGELMVVYHGTSKKFSTFKKDKIGSNTRNYGIFGYGFYFSDNEALAKTYNWSKNVPENYSPMSLYLNIENPFYWNGIRTEEQMNNFAQKIGLKDGVLEWNRYTQEIHTIDDEIKAKALTKALQNNGYDGIVYKYDRGQTSSEIVAFEPNQIKSTENANPTTGNNIYDKNIIKSIDEVKKSERINLPSLKKDDVLKVEAKKIAKQINETGGFNIKQRRWVETSTESEALKDKIYISDLDENKINYIVQSNKKSLDEANNRLKNYGYEESLKDVKSLLKNDRLPSAGEVALMERVIQEAVKKGDSETVADLLMDVAILGTDLGQATQALSIIKRLTPEGQLKLYTKIVQRAKARGEAGFEDVKITPEMIEKFLNTYNSDGTFDQEKLNKVVEDFKQKIADQLKTTTAEKIDAWRYLAMLGNPKTHIRNIVSNVAMRGTIKVKNAMARTLETIIPMKERTKTWKKVSDDVKAFSKETASELKDTITGENKYNEKTQIESKKKIFNNNTLEKISKFNSNALEAEDWFFSKRAFEDAFAEYLTANGIETAEDIKNNAELIDKAKKYAVNQAEIATFRQFSRLASTINKLERKNKLAKAVIEATVPFKRTPINVAKAGVNYSPLGLIKNITYDAYQLKKGNINASQFVDNLSQGLTGTSLTLLGYALAKAGILKGAGKGDKEDKYDTQLGNSGYSIKIGDNSYSLSWLSPVAMPLFVGANAYETLEEEKDWDMNVVSETLAKTLDPLNEMSFLSGLTNALNSYGKGTDKIKGSIESIAQSYVGQLFPTLFSQIASVTDDKKRSTKASANSSYKFGEQTARSVMLKIPGLRQQLEVSTDMWGNEKLQSSNILERAFESFIAPYSKNSDKTTDLDKELKKLYNETGNSGVIPGTPYAYITYGNNTYRMSAKEYTEYKKTYGQTANKLLNDTISKSSYKDLSYDEKAKVVENILGYSKYVANKNYFDKNEIDYANTTYKKAALYDEVGDVADYYLMHAKNFEADKDEDGKTISGSKKTKVVNYINSMKLSVPEKAILIKMNGYAIPEYDDEIIQYVVNQKLTASEKADILTMLGYTVKDGRVYK